MLAILALGVPAGGVRASLWADAGDAVLRSDVELLAAHGLIEGPVSTWPISWAQLERGLEVDADRTLPAHVRRSLVRVGRRLAVSRNRYSYGLEVTAATRPRMVQSFDRSIREEIDTRVRIERSTPSTVVRVVAGYEGDRDGDFKIDGTYVARKLGNWAVYGGYVHEWWGPAWGTSLILSNNARQFPRLGFTRLVPNTYQTRWLRWLGRWRVNGYLGLLDDARTVSAPLVFGARFTATPLRGLEIAVTRTFMICGDGRPCDFDTWIDALFPFNEADNTGTPDDPTNQLAGLGLRYALALSSHTLTLYGQYFGEDEIDLWVRSVFGLFGMSVGGPFPGDGHWRVSAEYSDTAADGVDTRSTNFNVVYNHTNYRTGYRYRGRAIGHGLDGDSRLFSLITTVTTAGGGAFHFRYHRANVNRDGACIVDATGKCRHTVSVSDETIHVIEAGLLLLTAVGEVGADVWWQDDRPNTPHDKDPLTGARLSWRRRF